MGALGDQCNQILLDRGPERCISQREVRGTGRKSGTCGDVWIAALGRRCARKGSLTGGSVVKNLPADAGGMSWIPGMGGRETEQKHHRTHTGTHNFTCLRSYSVIMARAGTILYSP